MKRYGLWAALGLGLVIAWLVFYPPQFWLNLTKSVDLSDPVAAGEQVVQQYNCRDCHRIGGEGALKAPNLAGVTLRINDPVHVTLRLWLQNPKAVKPNTAMPNFHLSGSEIDAILAYLAQLDNQSQSN
jgi:mono/diheme cytochrome c family protein